MRSQYADADAAIAAAIAAAVTTAAPMRRTLQIDMIIRLHVLLSECDAYEDAPAFTMDPTAAGAAGLFLGVFFGSSLIIEFIFSLDGLGQLGYRAAVERDYPVIFGTLFAFGLIGLVVGIISDLMYVLVDPRIDFERRG